MSVIDELERLERDYREELRTCALCLESGEKTWPNSDIVTRRQRTALEALPALLRLAKAAEEVADGLTVEYESCGGDIPELAADRMYFMLRDTLKELGVKV